jgi:hypothetical protein
VWNDVFIDNLVDVGVEERFKKIGTEGEEGGAAS